MAEKTLIPVKTSAPALRRWDPFQALEQFEQEMARRWGFTWPFAPRTIRTTEFTWMPSTDVYEKNGNLVIKAELPGVNKDDIKVTLEGSDLVIQGERKSESEVKEDAFYRMERAYGSFYRRLPLPFEVKEDQIVATYKDGVLEITMPKPVEQTPPVKPIKVA